MVLGFVIPSVQRGIFQPPVERLLTGSCSLPTADRLDRPVRPHPLSPSPCMERGNRPDGGAGEDTTANHRGTENTERTGRTGRTRADKADLNRADKTARTDKAVINFRPPVRPSARPPDRPRQFPFTVYRSPFTQFRYDSRHLRNRQNPFAHRICSGVWQSGAKTCGVPTTITTECARLVATLNRCGSYRNRMPRGASSRLDEVTE